MKVFNVDLQVVPSLSNSGFHPEIRPRETGSYSTNPSTLCWNLTGTNYHEDSNQKKASSATRIAAKKKHHSCMSSYDCMQEKVSQKILLIVHGMPVDTSSSVSLVLVFCVFSTNFCRGPSVSPVLFTGSTLGFFSKVKRHFIKLC